MYVYLHLENHILMFSLKQKPPLAACTLNHQFQTGIKFSKETTT